MSRIQGVNGDGEPLSSMYVDYGPSDYCWYPEGPSLTRQEFADECNINTIMAQYEKTGVVSHINQAPVRYLDLGDVPDLAQAMAIVDEAKAAFMKLPAAARREFDNDPVKFVQAIEGGDDALLERCREWGIVEPLPKAPEPQEVRVVSMPEGPAPAPK